MTIVADEDETTRWRWPLLGNDGGWTNCWTSGSVVSTCKHVPSPSLLSDAVTALWYEADHTVSKRRMSVCHTRLSALVVITSFTLLKELEASTHKSTKTHAGNVFVTRDLDLWPSNPKINGFPGLIVEHFGVKFGDLRFTGFWDIVRKNRQT